MKACKLVTVAALVALGAGSAWSVNSVVVQSISCVAGARYVFVGIQVRNDVPLCGLVIPLEIRAVTSGAFITSLGLSYGGRLNSGLNGVVVGVQHGTRNGNCSSGNPGYADLVFDSVERYHPVSASPEGAMFVRARGSGGDLPAGTDVSPSMNLVVNVGSTPGTFEIDTTCMVPNNHLVFAVNWPDVQAVTPAFTKGTVTVNPCNCPDQGDVSGNDGFVDVFDLIQEAAIAFNGGADVHDPSCSTTRGDVAYDGFTDVFDLIRMVNIAFEGALPDNPCTP